MNERIKKLAEQACFDEIGKDYSLYFNLTKDKVEKFAELIVRECMSYMEDGDIDFAKFMIKQHFGVEE